VSTIKVGSNVDHNTQVTVQHVTWKFLS